MKYMEAELGKAAQKMAQDLLCLKKGENVLIYADTSADERVVNALAVAATIEGAIPMVAWVITPQEVNIEPPRPLASAMKNTDVICFLEKMYIIHTQAILDAFEAGARADYFGGMDVDAVIRCIGNINFRGMVELGDAIVQLMKRAKTMRITTQAGTDLTYTLDPNRPVNHNTGISNKKGQMSFLGGQISVAPIEETINGVIVFDGALWPPKSLGLLKNPVHLEVEKGKVVNVKGKAEALILEKWWKSFNHQNVYNIAHISPGFNPGAQLCGNIVEDERVFGIVEIGIGSQTVRLKGKAGSAPTHTDGIMCDPTVWVDETIIEKDGEYVGPLLIPLAQKARERG
jgi:2,5-dihydroxypyridine 5,6-dioxygenase